MRPNITDPALIECVVRILKLAEKGGLPGKNIDLNDHEAVGVYLIVFAANRIDVEVLNAATPDILADRFFPTPGAMAEKCRPHRDLIESHRAANRYAGYVEAIDGEGRSYLAHPDRVRDGLIVERGGNGVAHIPDPEEQRRAIDDGRLRALLTANPEERTPLALGRRASVAPDREAELIEDSREWNALTDDEKRARRGS